MTSTGLFAIILATIDEEATIGDRFFALSEMELLRCDMDEKNQKLGIIEKSWIVGAIILIVFLIVMTITLGCGGDMHDVMAIMGGIASIAIIIVTIVVIYKFYAILKAIYNKLDSFDIPLKSVIESKKEIDSPENQKREQSVEEMTDDSELAAWKEKSIQSIKASIMNGKIDEDRGTELIRRVQMATQIPEIKK